MRLFIAIELPTEIRHQLTATVEQLRAKLAADSRAISWVKPENLHVTLKFLGEASDQQLTPVCDTLRSIPPVGAISLTASKIECLPPRGPLRVIAAGLTGDLDRLVQLHHDIETQSADLGFPIETRKFLPHVTLARVKQRLKSNHRDIQQWAQPLLPTIPTVARDFVLMQSQLKPAGPEYLKLARFSTEIPDPTALV